MHHNHLVLKKVQEGENKPEPDAIIPWTNLPLINGYFVDENTFLASGYDYQVALFKRKGTAHFRFRQNLRVREVSFWKLIGKL